MTPDDPAEYGPFGESTRLADGASGSRLESEAERGKQAAKINAKGKNGSLWEKNKCIRTTGVGNPSLCILRYPHDGEACGAVPVSSLTAVQP